MVAQMRCASAAGSVKSGRQSATRVASIWKVASPARRLASDGTKSGVARSNMSPYSASLSSANAR